MRPMTLRESTIDTEVNFWPAMIDMMTSLLMFFMLIYFVQNNVNPARLEAEVARRKQEQFTIVFNREFAADVARRDISVASDVNLLKITFGDEILFPPGGYVLRKRGETVLGRLARVVHEVDASSQSLYDQLQIEGHTDSRPMNNENYPRNNWDLSYARAHGVLRYLTERVSPPLDKATMSATGYADTRPLGGTWSRNRRIEIRFIFSGQEVLPQTGKERR